LSDFFFFQAEDGIRDRNVTGVQTCALPILCGRRYDAAAAFCEPAGYHFGRISDPEPDITEDIRCICQKSLNRKCAGFSEKTMTDMQPVFREATARLSG